MQWNELKLGMQVKAKGMIFRVTDISESLMEFNHMRWVGLQILKGKKRNKLNDYHNWENRTNNPNLPENIRVATYEESEDCDDYVVNSLFEAEEEQGEDILYLDEFEEKDAHKQYHKQYAFADIETGTILQHTDGEQYVVIAKELLGAFDYYTGIPVLHCNKVNNDYCEQFYGEDLDIFANEIDIKDAVKFKSVLSDSDLRVSFENFTVIK